MVTPEDREERHAVEEPRGKSFKQARHRGLGSRQQWDFSAWTPPARVQLGSVMESKLFMKLTETSHIVRSWMWAVRRRGQSSQYKHKLLQQFVFVQELMKHVVFKVIKDILHINTSSTCYCNYTRRTNCIITYVLIIVFMFINNYNL